MSMGEFCRRDGVGGVDSKEQNFCTIPTWPQASNPEVIPLVTGVLITTPARNKGSYGSFTAHTLLYGTLCLSNAFLRLLIQSMIFLASI